MRQRLLCVWSLMLSAVAAGHSISDTPFRNGVNFYVVNAKDEALRVEVLTDAGTPEPDREGLAAYLMLRCYGPDDRLVVAREVQLPRLQRWKVKLDVPSSGPGVYTLMVTGGAPDWVGIKPQPELPYGVMGRSRLEVRGDVLAKRFVYTPSEITLQKGELVTLRMESLDVTHGLYIDGYGIDIKARPGVIGKATFRADKTGRFTFRCSETCGEFHPYMIGYLTVEPNRRYHLFVVACLGAGIVAAIVLFRTRRKGVA